MSNAINSKRQQFRKDIIKKQKQQLFMQKRKELIRHLQYPQGMTNPVKDLKQGNRIKEAFEYIKLKITESDFFADLMKFIDEGLVCILIRYLQQRIQIHAVFQIIELILDKDKIRFDKSFYDYGLLQYVFLYLTETFEISQSCMRILNIYTQKSADYCQILLLGHKHKVLIQYFMKRANYSRNPEEQNDHQGNKIYTITLQILQNLITAKYESQTYNQYKLQIFQFILVLIEKRLFLRQTIGILYECVSDLQNSKQYFNIMLIYINQLLTEVKTEDKYLYNLFALIYNMIYHCPFQLASFNQFVKVAVMSKRVSKPFIRILQSFMKYKSQCLKMFPKDQYIWQKMFLAALDSQTQKILLVLIEHLQIKSPWIWKYYGQALASDETFLQLTSIQLINKIIKKIQLQQSLLSNFHLHRIPLSLERIVQSGVKGNKNTLVDKASHLLEYILGPMTEEYAHQANNI